MESIRERIVTAAAALLAGGGPDALTTRAVSAAAGVQDPAIYRHFGDKRGLLDAVAEYEFTNYVREKITQPVTDDPVDDLRSGWDLHVGFGLSNPTLYALIYGTGRPLDSSPATAAGADVLRRHIRRIAEAGRLAVGEERATQLVHAVGSGVTLALAAQPAEQRDPQLSTLAREAVLGAITTDAAAVPAPGPAAAAITLRAALPQTGALSTHETALLTDWLNRIADS